MPCIPFVKDIFEFIVQIIALANEVFIFSLLNFLQQSMFPTEKYNLSQKHEFVTVNFYIVYKMFFF